MASKREPELSGLGDILKANKGPAVLLVLAGIAGVVYFANHNSEARHVVHALRRAGASVEQTGGLYDVDFSGASVGGRELELLARLPGLRSLDLSGTGVGDDDLPHILPLTSLMELDLGGTKVTAAGVATLRKLSALHRLDLDRCNLGDDDLAVLAGFPALDDLKLSANPLTDAALRHLRRCPKLAVLDLSVTKVSDAGMPTLAGIAPLTELDLSNTVMGDAGLSALSQAGGLQSLKMRFTKLTDAGLAHLRDLPALRKLELSFCKISDAGMRHVGGVGKLESLSVDHTLVGDAGVAHLRGLPMRRLIVSFTSVTDKGMAVIGEMSGLQHLEIDGLPMTVPAGRTNVEAFLKQMRGGQFGTPMVTDAGLRHLKGLLGLRVLQISHAAVTDDGAAHLAGLIDLRRLGLSGTRVGDGGLRHFGGLKRLQHLDLGQTPVAGPGLAHLAGLADLRAVHLVGTRVGGEHMTHLSGLKNLKELTLSRTAVGDEGLAPLGRLVTLERLWLDGTDVTDAGLADLAGLSRLKSLYLGETKVTDAGLEHLGRLPALEEVNAHSTQVTAAAARAWLARTPPVRVLGPAEPEGEPARRATAPEWQEEMDPARVDALGDPLPKGARARLGTSRLYFPGEHCNLLLTPDGGTLIAYGRGHRILAWDARDGRPRYSIAVPEGEARSACLSPDGKLLAACVERAVRLWDVGTGRHVRDLKGGWSAGYGLAFAPDGRSLAVTTYPSAVRVIDAQTGKELLAVLSAPRREMNGDTLGGVDFAPDGKSLVVTVTETAQVPEWRLIGGEKRFLQIASQKTVIRVFDLPSGQPRRRLEGLGLAGGGEFADGGRLFLAPGMDKSLLVLETKTWRPVRRIPGGSVRYGGLRLLPDGRTVLQADEKGCSKWDVTTGRHVGRLDVPGWPTFSANGRVMAMMEREGQLSVRDAATGKELVTFDRHKRLAYPSPLAYAPDGRTLATAGADETIRLWDVAGARTAAKLATPGWQPSVLGYSPDGRLLAASGSTLIREQKTWVGSVRVMDAASGKVVFETTRAAAPVANPWQEALPRYHGLSVTGLLAVGRLLYPAGKLKLDADHRPVGKHSVLLYDTAAGPKPREVDTKDGRIEAVALSRDGKLAAWAGAEVGLIDTASGEVVRRVALPAADKNAEQHQRVMQFSLDGKQLAVSVGAKGTMLVDCGTGEAATMASPGKVVARAYQFTPGGRLLAAGKAGVYTSSGWAADVSVWDVRSGSLVRPAWRTDEVMDLAIAPDGGELATARYSGEVLLWPLAAP